MERGRGRFNTYIYRYNLILIITEMVRDPEKCRYDADIGDKRRCPSLQGHLNELWFGETHGGYETHSVLEGGVQGPLDHSLETVPGTVRHWGLKGLKGLKVKVSERVPEQGTLF